MIQLRLIWYKSFPNGKTGIYLLYTNRVCVSKKHYSAEVVTICMLLLQWGIPATYTVGQGFDSLSR